MAKQKLSFQNATIPKLKVASHYAGVTLGKSAQLGAETRVDVEYKNAQQLVNFTQYIGLVSGEEKIEEEPVAAPAQKTEKPAKPAKP